MVGNPVPSQGFAQFPPQAAMHSAAGQPQFSQFGVTPTVNNNIAAGTMPNGTYPVGQPQLFSTSQAQPFATNPVQAFPAGHAQPFPAGQAQPFPAGQAQPFPVSQAQPFPVSQTQPFPVSQTQPFSMTQPFPTSQAMAQSVGFPPAQPHAQANTQQWGVPGQQFGVNPYNVAAPGIVPNNTSFAKAADIHQQWPTQPVAQTGNPFMVRKDK